MKFIGSKFLFFIAHVNRASTAEPEMAALNAFSASPSHCHGTMINGDKRIATYPEH